MFQNQSNISLKICNLNQSNMLRVALVWEESILLPCETTINLPEVAKVEWKTRFNRKVHVYENRSDQLQDQDHRYRDRTQMNEDRLKTRDFMSDSGEYKCEVDGEVKRNKTVHLKVKGLLVSLCVYMVKCTVVLLFTLHRLSGMLEFLHLSIRLRADESCHKGHLVNNSSYPVSDWSVGMW
uniref:Ig-like domain-containing protein n=1 Tax=Haplochromis burtoni TaxID=8153 RepID=A0A3Q2X2D1_HAPBU